MTAFERPFRYHAIESDGEQLIGTYESQLAATEAVLRHGEQASLAPGQTKDYIVRIEAKDSGSSYDVELHVEAPTDD